MRIIRITRTDLKIIEGKFYDDYKEFFRSHQKSEDKEFKKRKGLGKDFP